jgi:hypothetical protein
MAGVAVLVLLGLVLRIHLLISQPMNSDQAVPGLMADEILHGHFYTFYWGQQYGGGEFYVDAFMFALFGHTPLVLDTTAVLLTAAAGMVLWRVALRMVPPRRRWLAAVVAATFWVWPEAAVWNSTRQIGFRALTMLAGVAAILLMQRLVEDVSTRRAAAAGLAVGIDLWSSPEFIYFLPVLLLMMVAGARRRADDPFPLRAVGALAAGAIVGALPWIWTNLNTGLASLMQSPSPASGTYLQRLSTFFHLTLPMMLSLRRPMTGAWLGGAIGQGLCVVAVVAIVISCLVCLRRHRHGPSGLAGAAVAAGLLLFPFEYSYFRATSFWEDGHYGVYCVPLILLVLAVSIPERLSPPRIVAASAGCFAAVTAVLTLMSFDGQFLAQRGLGGLLSGGPDPNRPAQAEIRDLQAAGIHYAYADYWVAYYLDFLSQETLAITDPSIDRWTALYQQVRASAEPAWLFFAPAQRAKAQALFGVTTPGPFAYPEGLFVHRLDGLGVTYRIDHLGVLDAVITSRNVTQQEVGMGNPLSP